MSAEDLDSLVFLEEQTYSEGRNIGQKEGAEEGYLDGYAMGVRHGYAKYFAMGLILGRCQQLIKIQQDTDIILKLARIISLIESLPTENGDEDQVVYEKRSRLILARYKFLETNLKLEPLGQLLEGSSSTLQDLEQESENKIHLARVWNAKLEA